jgi:hypothetical protein
MSLGTHVTGGTHWELDWEHRNKTQKKFFLWGSLEGGEDVLTSSKFWKRYPPALKNFGFFLSRGKLFK